MKIPAVTVLANERGQALLMLEGGWPVPAPDALTASETRLGTAIWRGREVIGLAQTSAMPSLATCSEFYLGDVEDGRVTELGKVSLRIHHSVPKPAPAGQ